MIIAAVIVVGVLFAVAFRSFTGGARAASAPAAAPAAPPSAFPNFAPTVDESGSPTNPALVTAMATFAQEKTRPAAQAFFRELARSTLLVPEDGDVKSRSGAVARITGKSEKVAVRMKGFADGTSGIPVFTDAAHLRQMYPQGSLVTSLPADVVARWVVADPKLSLLLNPRTDRVQPAALPRQLVEWLAQGLTELP